LDVDPSLILVHGKQTCFCRQRNQPARLPVRVGGHRGRRAHRRRQRGPGQCRHDQCRHRAQSRPIKDAEALFRPDSPAPGHRPKRIQNTITTLAGFGTRHTASSQTDPNRGIGAATAWVVQQMNAIAATSNGNMTVQQQQQQQQQQQFVQPVSSNIPVPTKITNVIATLQGTASPERFYVITGHLDSRCTDVLNFTDDAPGADDDASGVAVALELARLFATHQFPGTLVFATVDGEEQGLYGSTFMAQQMASQGNDVQAMFSNDIVGASQAFDGTRPDPFTVRMFSEGIPTDVTQNQISIMQSVGGENEQPVPAAHPVRPGGGAVLADRHEYPGDLAPRPVSAGQRPPVLPGPGLPGVPAHRAAGELQPRAPERAGGQRRAAR
jgi:hypothetical protein